MPEQQITEEIQQAVPRGQEEWEEPTDEQATTAAADQAKPRRMARRTGFALIGLGLLAFAGFLWESRVAARDARKYPMQGRLVDIGGYRLHLYCTGEGTPTVVMDSSFGESSQQWRFIQPAVSRFTRTCSYDRAGLGWSDPSPLPRSSEVVADELHALLVNAGIRGPYVLVGHSFAGLSTYLFASKHPEDVAGVVLVDADHPDKYRNPPSPFEKLGFLFYRVAAPIGVARLLGGCPIGPPSCSQYINTLWTTWFSRAESAAQVRARGKLGTIPLAVIAHDPQFYSKLKKQQSEYAHMQQQLDLVRLSPTSTFAIAKNTGHQIPTDSPELVVQAIERLTDPARGQKGSYRGQEVLAATRRPPSHSDWKPTLPGALLLAKGSRVLHNPQDFMVVK
ncbi:MAG TPA: alpha/beta hydrolase [Candidatus Acidoferrales bacterium]|nr:alpha/beta hydrolase [Candidatus Acidoferrales bacterium]